MHKKFNNPQNGENGQSRQSAQSQQNSQDQQNTQNSQNLQNPQNPAGQQPTTPPQAPDLNVTKIAELTNDLQRTRADFENYRKQMDAQKAQAVQFAKYETVKKFLPLLDDIDRAIAATPELAPLAKNLDKTLSELKLQKIDSAPNIDFNPDLHDAIMMEDSEGDKEVISETFRAGYTYEGNVIRPAMVKVKNI